MHLGVGVVLVGQGPQMEEEEVQVGMEVVGVLVEHSVGLVVQEKQGRMVQQQRPASPSQAALSPVAPASETDFYGAPGSVQTIHSEHSELSLQVG